MPVFLAPLFALFTGSLFAWVGRDGAARDRARERRAILVAGGYSLLIFVPALSWFLAFYGDWSYLYLVPAERIPSAVDAMLVGAAALLVPGVTLALVGRRAGTQDLVPRVVVASGTLFLLAFGLAWRRVAVHATYAQFHGDFGRTRIAGTPLGATFVLAVLVLAAGLMHGTRILRPEVDRLLAGLFRRDRRSPPAPTEAPAPSVRSASAGEPHSEALRPRARK
jgi:hypothetical protein